MHEISPGTLIANRILTTLKAKSAAIPDPSNIVHLQFRRFAGCPLLQRAFTRIRAATRRDYCCRDSRSCCFPLHCCGVATTSWRCTVCHRSGPPRQALHRIRYPVRGARTTESACPDYGFAQCDTHASKASRHTALGPRCTGASRRFSNHTGRANTCVQIWRACG
jgi:hypothetical protein